jgi:Zn-finger nucleic acid-binding protein
MHRRNYRKSSGVIIDVCKTHGTWLDADELEQIAGFILSGGQTSATLVEEERRTASEAAALAAARVRASSHYGTAGASGRGSGLLGLLFELLDPN